MAGGWGTPGSWGDRESPNPSGHPPQHPVVRINPQPMARALQPPGVPHHCTSPAVIRVPHAAGWSREHSEELPKYGLELDTPRGTLQCLQGERAETSSISPQPVPRKWGEPCSSQKSPGKGTEKPNGMLRNGCRTALRWRGG